MQLRQQSILELLGCVYAVLDLYTVLTADTDLILKDMQTRVCTITIIVRNSISGILILLK